MNARTMKIEQLAQSLLLLQAIAFEIENRLRAQ
jgi:hypothetical protein